MVVKLVLERYPFCGVDNGNSVEFFTQCTLTSQDAPWRRPEGQAGGWLDGEMPDAPQEEEEIEVELEVDDEGDDGAGGKGVSDPAGDGVSDPDGADDQGLSEVKQRWREAMPEVYWPMCQLGVDDNVFVDSQLA